MSNNKLGFLVDNLGATQLGYFLSHEINKYHKENDDLDILVYYQTLHKQSITRLFSVLQIVEAYSESCPLIATSLGTAFKLKEIKTCKSKWYYVWELEWLKPFNNHYELYYHIFSDDSFRFICRSTDEQNLLNNCFNIHPIIIEDFNMTEISNVIKNDTR